MPHIYVEYSDNITDLATQPLLQALNQCLIDGQYATAIDIKSRAVVQHDYMIGCAEKNQGYVHVKISLLTGRSLATQQAISQQALQVLLAQLPKQSVVDIQACVEILQMPAESYSKSVIKANT